MNYVQLYKVEIDEIKKAEKITKTKYLDEDGEGILQDDLITCIIDLVNYYEDLHDDYKKLKEELDGE